MTSFRAMFSLVFVVMIGTTTADNSSTIYDWTEKVCCGGVVSSRSERPYDTGCCGNTTMAYSYSKQLCCYDDETDTYSVQSQPSSNYYCCGKQTYDSSKQICCDDNVVTPLAGSTNTYCCGNQSYDTTKQSCCYNSNSFTVVNLGTACPVDPKSCYNTPLGTNQICCSIWNYTSQANVYQINDYSAGMISPQCCGLEVYDYSKETCCSQWNENGNIDYLASPDPDIWSWLYWYNPSCCGLTVYNPWTSLCCSTYDSDLQSYVSVINNYTAGYQTYDIQCCGTTAYNSTASACCYDSVTGTSSTITKSDVNTQCCGGSPYDSSNPDNQCCNFNKLYNVTTEMCCGDYPNLQVVTKGDPYDTQCCGSVTYNVGSEMCCDETKPPVPRPSASSTCCGENYSGCGGWYLYY